MKKYELTNETIKVMGRTHYRIKALVDIQLRNVKVGDWVEVRRSLGISHVMIEKIYNNRIYSRHGIDDHFDNIIRKLKPSEVVLDFGNGIKGTIEYNTMIVRNDGSKQIDKSWVSVCEGDIIIAKFAIAMITEPMRTTVLELLKAQSEEA